MIVAFQKALYQTLDSALTVPIYDYVPDNATYPYVVINNTEFPEMDYLSERKLEVFNYLFIFSDYKGQKEVLEIMEDIYTALHNKQLAMDEGRMVKMYVTERMTNRDMDGLTFTGRVRTHSYLEYT